jgi:hypothetical protein
MTLNRGWDEGLHSLTACHALAELTVWTGCMRLLATRIMG